MPDTRRPTVGPVVMRDAPRFLLGPTLRQLRDISPTQTVLEYLRTVEGLHGTKEGCAEGDCGACSVVLAEADGDRVRYRAVNACIMFVPALDGKQLLTVEHVAGPGGVMHPVQQAMVDYHASQCGFCTPGFVMSLFALHQGDAEVDHAAVTEALAGNLCRCTGYRPIVEAALAAGQAAPSQDAVTLLNTLDAHETLCMRQGSQTYIAPRSLAELADVLEQHPEATLLAGGTDVGIWVTKQHRTLTTIVALEAVRELRTIETIGDTLRIGPGVLYEDVLATLEGLFPDFGLLLRRLGSRQIRNRGTIGGNIGNASPIGDTPPVLIALGATVVLRRAKQQRTMPLEEFFLGYRQTVLMPGEFIERIDVPLPAATQHFRCYKVAKRFDQDISAVCGAFSLELQDGNVAMIRIGFGGMAATPVRARSVEQVLLGKPWTEATVQAAMATMDAAFTPISDMRAGAGYRRQVARNLLFKAFLETSPAPPRTRLGVSP